MISASPGKLRCGLCALILLAVALRPATGSDEPPATAPVDAPATQPATTQPTTAPAENPLASPRSTLRGFLLAVQREDFDDAAAFLDLSEVEESRRETVGRERVRHLDEVIDHFLAPIDFSVIPVDPDHPENYVLIADDEGDPRIWLHRGEDDDWRFSAASVVHVVAMYEALHAEPPATQPAVPPDVPEHLRNPRATVRAFLEAMNDAYGLGKRQRVQTAITCLDVSELPDTIQTDPTRLRLYAIRLFSVLNRTAEIVYSEIHNQPEGSPVDLREGRPGSIVINRVEDGRWLFSAETVLNLPELHNSIRRSEPVIDGLIDVSAVEFWIEDRVPESLRQTALGLQLWQWFGLGLLIFLGVLLDYVLRAILRAILERYLRRQHVDIDRKLKVASFKPFGLVAMGLLWWYGLSTLSLPVEVDAILLLAAKIVTVTAAVWAVYRLIDLLSGFLAAAAEKTESKFDDILVPLIRRSLKIGVTVVGLVFLAEVFQLPLTNILAGLGIGGLAMGFAAREVLQNFFGSLTILVDRPFHIGDWVKIGDTEGIVESVGFRSTRIRTFYDSLITVPNGGLLTATVDNLGARQYRRIFAMLSLTYDTPPEKIDAFCEGVRELIRRHPYTRKDNYQVYFNEFADASLNVMLYCFHRTPDWATELRERHRLFNDILRLARRVGVEFAFPTQTIHLHQQSGPPASAQVSPPQEPSVIGRRAATDIVRETGLEGHIPPPVGAAPGSTPGGEAEG